jgi:predicted  nucleic acid-binding Zn-ribbon protein
MTEQDRLPEPGDWICSKCGYLPDAGDPPEYQGCPVCGSPMEQIAEVRRCPVKRHGRIKGVPMTDTTREPDVEQAALEIEAWADAEEMGRSHEPLEDILRRHDAAVLEKEREETLLWRRIVDGLRDDVRVLAKRAADRWVAGQELYRVGGHNAACSIWRIDDYRLSCDCGLSAARQAWREASR